MIKLVFLILATTNSDAPKATPNVVEAAMAITCVEDSHGNCSMGDELPRGWWLSNEQMRATGRYIHDLQVQNDQLKETANGVVSTLSQSLKDDPGWFKPAMIGFAVGLVTGGVMVVYIAHTMR